MWSDLEEDTREVLSIEDRGQTHKQVRGRRDILSSHVLCLPTTPPPASSRKPSGELGSGHGPQGSADQPADGLRWGQLPSPGH